MKIELWLLGMSAAANFFMFVRWRLDKLLLARSLNGLEEERNERQRFFTRVDGKASSWSE